MKLLKNLSLTMLTLATCLATVSVNLSIPLAAHACGRLDFACKARKAAQKAKEATYRTQPYYITALAATKLAKRRGVIRGNDCRDLVETGSIAAGVSAAASGVATSTAVLVRVVGKDAGNLMCSDAGM
jgi:hypothetical protein